MINSIELVNFQSHENNLLEFDKNINVITGKSDNGKTAILRALYYAVYNRPLSNNYPSSWIKNEKGDLTGISSVKITKNNKSVTRYKSKLENGYNIDGTDLEAIRTDVPEQVKQFFNMSAINIQRQLDSHFLISETSGNIAKFFNELSNLDSIDIYLSNVEKLKRSTKKDYENCKEEIEKLETNIKKYDWIAAAEKVYTKYETCKTELLNIENKTVSLSNYIQDYNELSKELNKYSVLDLIYSTLQRFKKASNTLTIQEEKAAKIGAYIKDYKQITADLEDIPDIDKGNNIIRKIKIYLHTIQDKKDFNMELSDIIDNYNNTILGKANIVKEIQELEKQRPKICPLCKQPFKGEN